ncbi:MAG: NAD(P)-binding domain-containing protein [Myxococcaceae bacterium]
MTQTIAWLGTGLLGSGFVKAALKRGWAVRAWNRTPGKAKALEALGAKACTSIEEAVQGVERVHLCLSDDAAVDGALEAMLAVKGFKGPVIDHTTTTPKGTAARAAKLAAKGIGFLACPVFMGPANAAESAGRMLCAGPAALQEQLAPTLKSMTGELVQLGEDVTKPATLKLVGNSFIIGVCAVLTDALAVAKGGGLEPKDVLPFISNFPLGNIIAMRGQKVVSGDYSASFELTMARKDVRLMKETAGAMPLAVLDGLGQRMDALIAAGHGTKDLGALAVDLIPPAK